MNVVLLKGNVGHDPKVTTFDNGGKIAQFSLATTERGHTTKDGREIESRTTWHNCVVRGGLVGVCEQFVKKGSPILVRGRYESRTYKDNSGVDRVIYEVNVADMELCGGSKHETAPAPQDYDDLPPDFNL